MGILGVVVGIVKNMLKPKVTKPRRDRGSRARRIRLEVLARDKYCCQSCRLLGIITQAVEVDHIVPICDGGSNSPSNLQSLCVECHRKKTLDENSRRL